LTTKCVGALRCAFAGFASAGNAQKKGNSRIISNSLLLIYNPFIQFAAVMLAGLSLGDKKKSYKKKPITFQINLIPRIAMIVSTLSRLEMNTYLLSDVENLPV
jgi:hypothetical protein